MGSCDLGLLSRLLCRCFLGFRRGVLVLFSSAVCIATFLVISRWFQCIMAAVMAAVMAGSFLQFFLYFLFIFVDGQRGKSYVVGGDW